MSKYKRKQSNIVSSLKRKNLNLIKELREYEKSNDLSETEKKEIQAFVKRVYPCANISLYKENNQTNIIDYLASHTCGSKTCAVCNFLRQKSIRRKYGLWFKQNELLFELESKKTHTFKFTTEKQYLAKYCNTHKLLGRHRYDIMHLTLTVPHTMGGFKGETYYFEALKNAFYSLRKNCEFWNWWVFGGEYGIETTSGSWLEKEQAEKKNIPYSHEKEMKNGKIYVRRWHTDGLHIHLHALLFVRKAEKNRNKLHREILLAWNRITADANNPREPFTNAVKFAIKKGNELLTDQDIDKLSPKGATFINLETIFTIDKRSGKKIRGGHEFNSDAMRKAVMETISYHFEPMALNKADNTVDIPLLIDLLVRLRKMGEKGFRFYDKFGCLVGEKSLNIKDSGNAIMSDFKEVLEILVDENTGEYERADDYFICNPATVFHVKNKLDDADMDIVLNKAAKNQKIVLPASNTTEAISQMNILVAQSLGSKRKKEEKNNSSLARILKKQEKVKKNKIQENTEIVVVSDVLNETDNYFEKERQLLESTNLSDFD